MRLLPCGWVRFQLQFSGFNLAASVPSPHIKRAIGAAGTKEKLKPFSEAFRAREIANERDHYRCSSFDDCNALMEAFLIRLDEQKNLGKHPFKDEKRWLKQKAVTAKKTGSPGSMVERFTSDPHGHGPSVYSGALASSPGTLWSWPSSEECLLQG